MQEKQATSQGISKSLGLVDYGAVSIAEAPEAVSYTHLTLPTTERV